MVFFLFFLYYFLIIFQIVFRLMPNIYSQASKIFPTVGRKLIAQAYGSAHDWRGRNYNDLQIFLKIICVEYERALK